VPTPNMPTLNPWLTNSVYPTSHMNPAATESVPFAGPTGNRTLTRDEAPIVSTLFISNPTVKTIGADTVAIASGALSIQKIRITGDAFELIGEMPYPGLEAEAAKAKPDAVAAIMDQADAAFRAKDDAGLIAAANVLEGVGFTYDSVANGVYNLIDRDGFHYCVYGGVNVLKTTDDNQVDAPLRVVKSVKVTDALPPDVAAVVTRIMGLNMTYDGFIAAAAPGALVVLDRDLNVKASITFPGEAVDNSICVDEQGSIYVVTSKRMLKVIWNGETLSTDEADGAWATEYNAMDEAKAKALGAGSRGSGPTPTLMGFGDDRDKCVVIADADEAGTNLVACWRDEIPEDFEQKPGAKSRRIADQIPIELSLLTIEPSPAVLGYGVALLNSTFPDPAGMGHVNAFVSGVTRTAPLGIVKFVWKAEERRFEHAWTNPAIDNTDWMVPNISAATNTIYVAHKEDGIYQYLGLDWDTGEVKDRWVFPDDSRVWNAFGGITGILENGDLMIGGFFAAKRLRVGNSGA
jgi:hypothetical protein